MTQEGHLQGADQNRAVTLTSGADQPDQNGHMGPRQTPFRPLVRISEFAIDRWSAVQRTVLRSEFAVSELDYEPSELARASLARC